MKQKYIIELVQRSSEKHRRVEPVLLLRVPKEVDHRLLDVLVRVREVRLRQNVVSGADSVVIVRFFEKAIPFLQLKFIFITI